MEYLYKVFNKEDSSTFQEVYHQRINFHSSVRIGLSIQPINYSRKFELFYIPTNLMIEQLSEIYSITGELNGIYRDLPRVARQQFITECLIEELYNTNQLEGVRSSRKEIAMSARDVRLNKKSSKRFMSMVELYGRLTQQKLSLPKNAEDIRSIYDSITKGEIDDKELPDGDLFRKDETYVYKKSGSGKIIHRGIMPEESIVLELSNFLDLMNNNEEIPLLIKTAIGHYFFGYIHPFYDGNGRTSRFISSMYLAKSLGTISSLSLSRGSNKYTKRYLEGFELTNSIKSRGEMNLFIETFLDIIVNALREMISELKEKDELLRLVKIKISKDPKLNSIENNSKIMYVLAQNFLFTSGAGLTTRDLATELSLSKPTVRKYADELLNLSLIETMGKSPKYYKIKQSYLETE